jgi:hypothetical protein
MKNFNLFILFVFSLLLTISCTNEKSEKATESSAYRLVDDDLKKSQSDFLAIMSSSAWINHENAAKNFAVMLSGTPIDLSTLKKRESFNTFITANLSKTKWTDVSSAMNQYDQLNELGNVLNTQIEPFMISLRNADLSDIKAIFAPAFVIPQLATYSPCEIGCKDAYDILCNQAYNTCIMEVTLASLAGASSDTIKSIRQYWECMEGQASANYSNCLEGC